MARALYSLGRLAVRHRRMVVVLWVLIAVGLSFLGRAAGGSFSDDFRVPGAESQEAIDLLGERFPDQAGGRAQVVLHVDEGSFSEPDRAAAIEDVMQAISRLEHVVAEPMVVTGDVISPGRPEAARTALAEVRYDADVTELGEVAHGALHDALEPLAATGVEADVGGELATYAAKPKAGAEEVIGIVAAVIILLVAFGSITAMGLPIGIALFGLMTGTALVTLLAAVMSVSNTAPMLGSMIGIGVGIDYALFIVTRHREHLADGLTVEDAAARANATSGLAVIFAGGTVVIAISGLALVGLPIITTMGYAAAIIVTVMVLASVTLLPALLGFAGTKLAVATLPWVRRREVAHAERVERLARLGGERPRTRWERWAQHVSSHPWPYLVSGILVMLLLAAPLLSMRIGQTDASTAAEGSSLRRAYERLAEGFGPGFNGPLLVVLDVGADGADGPVLARLQELAADAEGVALVAPPQVNASGDTVLVPVIPDSAPQSEATTALVHRLRHEVLPAAVDGTQAAGYVTGITAVFVDLSDKVADRLPWFIGVVVGLSFVLLMAVFRSVLVPLKAALLNLLSIGAAYGVVVAVFQWGWMKGLVGMQETVPIVSFVPMFMFAILFGLSMDYEVFLLSRVREEYTSGKDNTEAVVQGLAGTARVITSAALIMICVFLGFVLGHDPVIKMMGVGLATAVLVDATIVRVVLVPATMRLMGDANWWLPRWLDRILPNLDVEGGAGLPAPERRDALPSPDGVLEPAFAASSTR